MQEVVQVEMVGLGLLPVLLAACCLVLRSCALVLFAVLIALCVCARGMEGRERAAGVSKGSSSSGSTRIRRCLSLYLALCPCLIGASFAGKLGYHLLLLLLARLPPHLLRLLLLLQLSVPVPGKLTAAGPSVAYFLQPSDDAVPLPAANLKCNLIQIQLAQSVRGRDV